MRFASRPHKPCMVGVIGFERCPCESALQHVAMVSCSRCAASSIRTSYEASATCWPLPQKLSSARMCASATEVSRRSSLSPVRAQLLLWTGDRRVRATG